MTGIVYHGRYDSRNHAWRRLGQEPTPTTPSQTAPPPSVITQPTIVTPPAVVTPAVVPTQVVVSPAFPIWPVLAIGAAAIALVALAD